ncbi:GNAT family N-acetyltransferase, partial [Pseudomonas syringae]
MRDNERGGLRRLGDAGGALGAGSECGSTELASMYCGLGQRGRGVEAAGARHQAVVMELLRDLLIGSVVFLNDAPVAFQLV